MTTIEATLGTEVDRFLRAISPMNIEHPEKLGPSAATYRPGLVWFQQYLSEQTLFPEIKTIHDFLVAVKVDAKEEDSFKQTFPDRELLKGFASSLIGKCKAPKTVRSYCGAIQSLGTFFKIPISAQYSDLPPAIPVNEKYAWNIKQVGTFIKSFKSPLYRCLGVWYIQTGLSNYDLLHLSYGKIKEQYQNDVSPFCINLVRYKTRKFEIKFRAFIGALGIRYFREYYESLPHALDDNDMLFKISDNAIEYYFARRAREFLPKGFEKRNPCCPSSLRTGFRTFLSDAKVDSSIIEYWMGHNLTADLAKTYTNKSDDSWRATWRESEKALTFSS
jgi:hypothetical protein